MAECRYNGNCCVMYHRPFDSDELPCDGYDEDICSLYEPMPDVESLLELADEMDNPLRQAVWNQTPGMRREHIMSRYARRIREALGVTDA